MSMGNSSQENSSPPLVSAKNSSSSSLPPLPLVFLSLSPLLFSSSFLPPLLLHPSSSSSSSHLSSSLSSLSEGGSWTGFPFAACVCATGRRSYCLTPSVLARTCEESHVKLNLCPSAVSSIRPGGRSDTGRTRSAMKRRWKRCWLRKLWAAARPEDRGFLSEAGGSTEAPQIYLRPALCRCSDGTSGFFNAI